jgi:23S rRNA (adenine-N6)-dimethyltransferase
VAGRSARGARHVPRRPRSQHFLRSPRVAAALVADAAVSPHDLVLDLGAGSGRLTAPLAALGARVRAIELDPLWAGRLRERFADRPNVTVVEADVRDARLPAEPFRVVANVPFHLTTAILRRLLDDPRTPLERADLLVEWEVARKRARCWPSTLLNVVWGVRYELAAVRRVPAACFEPRPDADAGVLRVTRRGKPLLDDADHRRFRALVEAGFRAGAPTLRASLAARVPDRALRRALRELGLPLSASARELDVHQWAAVFSAVAPSSTPSAPDARLRPTRTPLTRSREAGKESE